MKIKKRITIVADILVDEDFDTNYLCICEWQDIGDDSDLFLGRSDNFQILNYISQEAIEINEDELVNKQHDCECRKYKYGDNYECTCGLSAKP